MSVASNRSRCALKSAAPVSFARPGIVSQPGDSRSGWVSERLSCAVNPPADHTAAPSTPLPSGIACSGLAFGARRTTSERRTRLGTLTENDPSRHAVVPVAACAPVAMIPVSARPATTVQATVRLRAMAIQSYLFR